MARKWIEVNVSSGSQYSITKNIKFKNPLLRSDLYDYIIVKRARFVKGTDDANQKKLVFNSTSPLRLCISKIKTH